MNSSRMPLLLAIVAGGLGLPVALYYLIWSPLTDLQQREEALGVILSKELKENGDHLKIRKEILKAHPRLEDWKVLSWPEPKTKPADRHINDLQAEYRILLEDIVEDSGLDEWNVDLTKPIAANATALKKGGKKDQWQAATYRISGNGSLEQIAKVLEGVYKMPTLHRVANLTIKRDDNDKKNLTKDKLELALNVEALSMVGAEKRDDLLATLKAPKYPLINKSRKHASLLAKANPFLLPAPPAPLKTETPTAPPVVKEEKPKEDREEYLTSVRFTSVSSYERGSKTGWLAHFHDQNNNGDKKIYSLGLRRDLGFTDMYGNDVLTGELVFANERSVVLLIDGAYFRFYVGDDLYPDESRMLLPEEYKALGLPPPPKPQPKKPVVEEDDS